MGKRSPVFRSQIQYHDRVSERNRSGRGSGVDPSRGHALITGALGGLGTAMVRRLTALGVSVVACDRRADDAEAWLSKLDAEERDHVVFHPLDVTREEQVEALARELSGAGPPIAYLVNNAGIQGPGNIWEFESRTWERVVRVNLGGTFYVTRAFSGPMVERGFGRIVNLASLYAYHPGRGQHPYAAAKAAITGLTRSTAVDLARHGVTVNAIAPGYIVHEGLTGLFPEGALDELIRQVPVGRAGRPEEIAATLEFLLSEDAAYITGQTIHVNGGVYLPG